MMDIFLSGINSVLPKMLIKNNVQIVGSQLLIQDKCFPLNKNVYVVGFGKAVLGLAINIFHILEEHIVGGVLSVPTPDQKDLETHPNLFKLPDRAKSLLEVSYGPRNNLPDSTVLSASTKIFHLAESLKSDDILLTLITGGGSALLCHPVGQASIHLSDVVSTTQTLAKSGADIHQLNTVRSQLDLLKGGGLARVAHPSQVISLILSDVIGDDLSTIASGPTVLSTQSTPESCLKIFADKNITHQIPESILNYLREKSHQTETPNPPSYMSPLPYNCILATNKTALQSCKEKANSLGYQSFVLTDSLSGDASEKAEVITELVRLIGSAEEADRIPDICKSLQLLHASRDVSQSLVNHIRQSARSKAICLLIGGETTVKVDSSAPPDSRGGRCSHMALTSALCWHHSTPQSHLPNARVQILFGATDGMDGASDGAGAWITPRCVAQAEEKYRLNARSYLSNFDSYSFFRDLNAVGCDSGGLVMTGLTGTNVMDLIVITIDYS